MTQTIVPVILCGGAGTRLWPLSRQGHPKQFLAFGMQDSLFTQALNRLQYFAQTSKVRMESAPFVIVAHEEHRFLALEQLRAFGAHNTNLILEPEARNTAPALSLAAALAQDQHSDPVLVICPSDQYIPQNEEFVSALDKAIAAITHDPMRKTAVLFGITPTGPETGYGYMQCKSSIHEGDPQVVLRFVEKPDLTTAQEYLRSEQYLWNSGIFVMHASTWLNGLPLLLPGDLINLPAIQSPKPSQHMAESHRHLSPRKLITSWLAVIQVPSWPRPKSWAWQSLMKPAF